MNGAVLLLIASAAFLAGYFIYAKLIERKLGVDPSIPTPAHTKKDGVDFIPAHPTVLFGHHFAAIAGAGPIVMIYSERFLPVRNLKKRLKAEGDMATRSAS